MTGYVVAYLYLALGLSVLTDGPFMDTLDGLVRRYRLPSDVAGATLLAMASSAPELFTSVLDTFVFQNHIGIGTIIGSAIFNLLTIIAVSAWSTREALALNPSKVKRDIFWALENTFGFTGTTTIDAGFVAVSMAIITGWGRTDVEDASVAQAVPVCSTHQLIGAPVTDGAAAIDIALIACLQILDPDLAR